MVTLRLPHFGKARRLGAPDTKPASPRGALHVVVALFGLFAVQAVTAAALDLNDFYADPTVTVAGDGSSALIEEEAGFGFVLLANDPGLGDPEVLIAAAGEMLSFNYEFDEAPGNADEFSVFIIDATTGASVGAPFELFFYEDAAGRADWLLDDLVGRTLGLQFQLARMPGDTDNHGSLVSISNVRVHAMPLPPAAALLMLPIATLIASGRRRAKAARPNNT